MEGFQQFLPMILIFAVAYFFMIRPQIKRQKDEKKFTESLKRGDRIVTKSGLHGKVVDLNDKDASCIIETMAGRLKFDRSAISLEMSKKVNQGDAK
ncbi:preprotein translocase subunit YajC [Robiginitalea sp. M366]|uniref:preprotein translocase subunit YajC n=1 Tax=Robiginitalea aestuariiviva TaxID=3036903 RepID=UPI00240D9F13|nr:preprotein translocase subunit YajC [Robiginitalea aestuariiviva]MDG1572331.1 preprotein translocase subunit YajC [Robiginitalea aestuariiviva]